MFTVSCSRPRHVPSPSRTRPLLEEARGLQVTQVAPARTVLTEKKLHLGHRLLARRRPPDAAAAVAGVKGAAMHSSLNWALRTAKRRGW